MNLLITIIGNKFNEIMGISKESVYSEQADMLLKFSFLMDIDKELKNMKYIVSINLDNQTRESQDTIEGQFDLFKKDLVQQNTKL